MCGVLWEKEEVASELDCVGRVPGAARLGRLARQREVTAFILAVKKFMKTRPVREMAGVQPVPRWCSWSGQ